jgi:hypothetical protein
MGKLNRNETWSSKQKAQQLRFVTQVPYLCYSTAEAINTEQSMLLYYTAILFHSVTDI